MPRAKLSEPREHAHAQAILLVDDQPQVRGAIASALKEGDPSVFITGNGAEAIPLLKVHPSDSR